jgi:hypothetical protein
VTARNKAPAVTGVPVVLLKGPAGGHKVTDDRPVIWVAVLDDEVHVLPDRPADDGDIGLLLRVRGAWEMYRRTVHPGSEPAYEWVPNPPRE